MEKTIEELKADLYDMRNEHLAAWKEYGSELCAGEMLRKERELENKIKELENGTE